MTNERLQDLLDGAMEANEDDPTEEYYLPRTVIELAQALQSERKIWNQFLHAGFLTGLLNVEVAEKWLPDGEASAEAWGRIVARLAGQLVEAQEQIAILREAMERSYEEACDEGIDRYRGTDETRSCFVVLQEAMRLTVPPPEEKGE